MNFDLKSAAHIFFCTGARNHELLKIFDPAKITFEYDERMASFKALGLAHMTGKPVIICCTSGTAVAECLPALLEARYSNTPLVLISGDRPFKMHGTGAPQTINHRHLTEKVVGTYLELPLEKFAEVELNPAYPLHLNILVDDTVPHDLEVREDCTIGDFRTFITHKRSPLFLFSHEASSMRELIKKFAATEHLFYAETLSGGREFSRISSERDLIRMLKGNKFDAVIRIGHTPLSKIWRLLETQHLPVFSFDERHLPGLSYGMVSAMSSQDLMASSEWWNILDEQKTLPALVKDSDLEKTLNKYPLSEMSVMKHLQDHLPENALVYLGNSLVIRFFELVQNRNFRTFGNRGVNGIDGQLATAVGIALGTQEKVTCILGDITTLYDLSSLREMPQNLRLVIMNNAGGRIFDMLGLDQRIIMEHEVNFKSICQGFKLSYGQIDLSLLDSVQVLELSPDPTQTRAFLKDWNA